MRTMAAVHDRETCSVAACAEILGTKWTALIVHELSEGARRFSEIEHSCAGISPRTLSERLRALEQEGILARRSFAERQIFEQQPLVRRVHVRLTQREAGDHRRDPLGGERRDDRQRSARPDEQRARPERALERVERELDRRRVGIDESGLALREELHLDLGAVRGGLP